MGHHDAGDICMVGRQGVAGLLVRRRCDGLAVGKGGVGLDYNPTPRAVCMNKHFTVHQGFTVG